MGNLSPRPEVTFSWGSLTAFATAMVLVLWAYGGWSESVLVAGEVRRPERNLPRSILSSVLVCMILYVLTNLSYLSVLGVEEISGVAPGREAEVEESRSMPGEEAEGVDTQASETRGVAEMVISRASGRVSRELVSLLVAISVLGVLNGLILTGARITYAAAQDHPLFAWLGKPNEKYRTPAMALTLQAIWAAGIVLIFRGYRDRVEKMIWYMGFAVWLFYGLVGIGVILLRRRFPEARRPFRAWGYPVTPVVFVAQSFFMMVVSLFSWPVGSLYCGGLILLGIPVYLAFSSREPTAS
jgi:amino acid transporter